MSLITINIKAYNDTKLDQLISLTQDIGEKMATQADIDALSAQVTKVQAEVVAAADALRAQIAALQAIIDAGQPVIDLTGLQSALQVLDDLNPDA
jgi:hypothetical protein